MIRACIYNGESVIGCITPSVLDMFKNELAELECSFSMDASCHGCIELLRHGLELSMENCDASFLDAVRNVRKECCGNNADFLASVSKMYCHLLTYCCSNHVYEEVLSETITEFGNDGLMYIGHKCDECGTETYSFDFSGITVLIEMCDKNSLYSFWNDDNEMEHTVIIVFGGRKICLMHRGDVRQLCKAVKACVCDFMCNEKAYSREEVAKMLLEVAKSLVRSSKH